MVGRRGKWDMPADAVIPARVAELEVHPDEWLIDAQLEGRRDLDRRGRLASAGSIGQEPDRPVVSGGDVDAAPDRTALPHVHDDGGRPIDDPIVGRWSVV